MIFLQELKTGHMKIKTENFIQSFNISLLFKKLMLLKEAHFTHYLQNEDEEEMMMI